MKRVFTVALTVAALLPAISLQAEELPAPLRALEGKGIEVVSRFDAPAGLQGYAGKYQNQGVALYLTWDQQHVLVGNLFDAKGQDVGREALERLVYAPMAAAMWGKLASSNWIADGSASAPRIVYMLSDPNCPYCSMFWQQARPWVDSGKVQVRHIMVGILRPDSLYKAAALMAMTDPAKGLLEHERAGKASMLKPLRIIPAAIQAKLDGNQQLMDELGAQATPVILYQGADGRMQQQQGAPRAEQLADILGAL
jgi:thiol:disulfide interchange protein DsbG